MEDNISKGLFGFNKKEVEIYIAGIKHDYEAELKKQNTVAKQLNDSEWNYLTNTVEDTMTMF